MACSWCVSWMNGRDWRTHRTALDGRTRKEFPVPVDRPCAAVGIQPSGGLRECQRPRAPLPVPAHRLGEGLGARSGVALALAVVRDATADATRKPCRLARIGRDLIAQAEVIDSAHRVELDMASTEVPGLRPPGAQRGTTGTSSPPAITPAVVQPRSGPAAKLRPGNAHSAAGWEEPVLPEIERQQQQGNAVVFRADAAFAKPEISKRWKGEMSGTRSACPPTTTWSAKLQLLTLAVGMLVAAGGKSLDPAAIWRDVREGGGSAVADWRASAAGSVTRVPRREREKVSANRLNKRHFVGLCGRERLGPASGAAGGTMDQNWAKTLWREALRGRNVLKSRTKWKFRLQSSSAKLGLLRCC